jgi:hypothetical protein
VNMAEVVAASKKFTPQREPSSAAPPEAEMIYHGLPQRNGNWTAPAKLEIVGWPPTALSAAPGPFNAHGERGSEVKDRQQKEYGSQKEASDGLPSVQSDTRVGVKADPVIPRARRQPRKLPKTERLEEVLKNLPSHIAKLSDGEIADWMLNYKKTDDYKNDKGGRAALKKAIQRHRKPRSSAA